MTLSLQEKEARFFLKLKVALDKSRVIARSCLA